MARHQPRRVLFVCGRNKWRSPTAEQLYGQRRDLETDSAGLSEDAETVLSAEQVEWADIIFVMEPVQRRKIQMRFKPLLKSKRVICLDIPDRYIFMQPELVALLRQKLDPLLGASEP